MVFSSNDGWHNANGLSCTGAHPAGRWASRWPSVCITSPAKTSQRTHLYLGRVECSSTGGVHGLAHEGEDIRVVCVPATQAIAQAESGHIDSAWALIALLWFARHREGLRVRWSAGE